MMNTIRFKKTVTVDYEDTRLGEIVEKTFSTRQVVKDVIVEELSKNFSNLHFMNSDLAINVPNNTFEIC